MNLSQGNYNHNDVWKKLCSNNRKVHYEYTVHDNDGKLLGSLTSCSGRISYDSTRSVMRTFEGDAKKTELLDINMLDERITPWFCLTMDNGEVLKYPLGKFIISPSFDFKGPENIVHITGYDLGKVALDYKTVSRVVMNADDYYSNEIQEILSEMYPAFEVISSPKKRRNALEWEPGTSKITIINDMLSALNYYPLHFDEYGIPKAEPYILPEERTIEAYYKTDASSVIVPGISQESNRFDVPNKYVRYVENADSEYMVSSYTNEDPSSIFSTVNRGRVIVDIERVSDIASQKELDDYVKRCAVSAMSVTEQIKIKTLNMPGHGFRNCLLIETDKDGILGKYIETGWEMSLELGAEMTHRCVKAVNIS